MKNKKLSLQKTTITKLSNLDTIRGGSFGDGTNDGGQNTGSLLCPDINDPTKTHTTKDFPDLTTTVPQ